MPLDRPQTLINKGFAILRGALKRVFLGQVSLLGSRRHYPNQGCHKASTTRMLLPTGSNKVRNKGYHAHLCSNPKKQYLLKKGHYSSMDAAFRLA